MRIGETLLVLRLDEPIKNEETTIIIGVHKLTLVLLLVCAFISVFGGPPSKDLFCS